MFINVVGIPAPQGSKKSIGNNRFVETSKKLPAWRKAVKEAAEKVVDKPFTDAVKVDVVFYMPRPKTVTRLYPTVPPDCDKLLRSTFDALTHAGVWTDDALVCKGSWEEVYADSREPGCELTITAL